MSNIDPTKSTSISEPTNFHENCASSIDVIFYDKR